MDDDLHHRFKDLLQETPEAEDALRAYRNKQGMAEVTKRIREKNLQVLENAYEW
ncbi:hypothetical protein [Mesorhizobium sp. B2-4-17]|uniref:hypothetical protein n=1 Tax=Mesorhizobium sp. B2-4-17 TaxID=2589932 RepID=UPI0015E3C526|nr:hypothetical protein [Mesorhizobium sp. B2-4-17]